MASSATSSVIQVRRTCPSICMEERLRTDSDVPPQITVGGTASSPGGVYQFSPPNIVAPVGTTVTFLWKNLPRNHSVTQSSAESPCAPLKGGFNSGFLSAPPNTTAGFPSWNLTITAGPERASISVRSNLITVLLAYAAPPAIYFFCAQTTPSSHCEAGMVGYAPNAATPHATADARS